MPIIVADASPLSLLIRIEEVSLLHQLFERVVIPDEVLAELRHGNAPDVVRGWCAQLPGWIDVRSPKRAKQNDQLDSGELAAISLALELKAPRLMDERLGRAFAKR
jgi:predicted nucleic acid-binding protein